MNDPKLEKIKSIIRSVLPNSEIILFGSRAQEEFRDDSDYDIMVVVKHSLSVKEKRQHASLLRKKLAKMEIDADIIVKTENDVSYYSDKIGSLVREAILSGVNL